MSEEKAVANNKVEIWRKEGNDSMDPYNNYQPSIYATITGAIMICVGGYCITMPVEEWHKLAGGQESFKMDAEKRDSRSDEKKV